MKIQVKHIIDEERGIYGAYEFEVPDTSRASFEEATRRCQTGLAVIFNEQDRKDGKQK